MARPSGRPRAHGRRRSPLALAWAVGALVALLATGFVDTVAADAAPAPLAMATTALNAGEVGVAYSDHLLGVGGVAPYQWSTTSTLPPGLALASNGFITGSPTASADVFVTLTLTDTTSTTVTNTFELVIGAPPTITTTTSLPDPVVGVPYSAQLGVTGGTGPYVWSINAGPLPLGLVLNSDGLLSGLPTAAGSSTTTFAVADALGGKPTIVITINVDPSPATPQAYLVADGDGSVSAYASAGVAVPQTVNGDPDSAIVGIASDATGAHYWLADATGEVVASAGARAYGSVARKHLSGRIVGIAVNPAGTGYWLASSSGKVYGFGAARSYGSVAPRRLKGQIVGIAANANGSGYWLASSSGAVYAFGTARVRGTRTRLPGDPRIVGIAADPSSAGYWLVNDAGRVFAHGPAAVAGSIPAGRHLRSVVAITASPSGGGYWLLLRNGVVEPFGTASPLAGIEVDNGTAATAIVRVS